MRTLLKWIFYLVVIAAIGGGVWLAMREQPALVDLAEVTSRPMQVTINEEGSTRVRDVYTVSSPIAGNLDRPEIEEGEAVTAHITVIANIHPLDPPFLDERTRSELAAAVEAAKSAVALGKVELTRAQTGLRLARSEFDRASKLARTKVISQSRLEKALSDMHLQEAQVQAAQAAVRLRQAELATAEARLRQPTQTGAGSENGECCITITSPIDGVVLKVLAKSAQAVQPGTRIAEIGDPSRLEIVVDLVSSDAPKIAPGSKAIINGWGGEGALTATVRRIDPAAFTKVSSLGIEEQRVNAVLDLDETPDALGHGYRVLARLVVWSGEDILQVPIGALFRTKGKWSVFAVEDGKANLRIIETGRMNDQNAQIVSGLTTGDRVILYPNDTLEDGALVEPRESGA